MAEQRFTESEAVRHEMLGLLSGYWFSQCLYVIAKLNVVEHLSNLKLSSKQLAKLCSASPSALTRLMNALSQAGMFNRDQEQRYSNTPHSLTLSSAHPNSLKWHALLGGDPLHWQAWGSLLTSIKSGECAFELTHGDNFYSLLQQNPESKQVFDKVMASNTLLDAEIVANIDVKPCAKVIDLGGGSGNLLANLKQKDPSLDCVLVELPDLSNYNSEENQRDQSWAIEHGDILDEVPANASIYILKFVLHNWDDNRAIRILKNCSRSMTEYSKLLVVEMLLPGHNTQNATGHASKHDINMMVLTGGKERTLKNYETLLKQAGLELNSVKDAGNGLSLLQARQTRN